MTLHRYHKCISLCVCVCAKAIQRFMVTLVETAFLTLVLRILRRSNYLFVSTYPAVFRIARKVLVVKKQQPKHRYSTMFFWRSEMKFKQRSASPLLSSVSMPPSSPKATVTYCFVVNVAVLAYANERNGMLHHIL